MGHGRHLVAHLHAQNAQFAHFEKVGLEAQSIGLCRPFKLIRGFYPTA
jgi:hypothetical protein